MKEVVAVVVLVVMGFAILGVVEAINNPSQILKETAELINR